MKKLFCSGAACLLLALMGAVLLPQTGMAQEKQNPPPASSLKEAAPDGQGRQWPVLVAFEGADLLGRRLALRLKERLDASPLFRLARQDEKAVKVLLTSRTEIQERPAFGSVYAAVWMYAEGKDVLAYFLDAQAGSVDEARLDAEADRLAANADKIAERYAYLFE
ncbi:MAG: hypothetical protein AB7D07_00185 [Desulfovibrionaceae bacterium]